MEMYQIIKYISKRQEFPLLCHKYMIEFYYLKGNKNTQGDEWLSLGMHILYKNDTVKKQFCSEYKKKWKYPEQVKIKLIAAENYILNADSLMDIACYPPFHFERLKGKRKDEWSIRLGNTGYRVAVIPCDDEGKEITEGDIIAKCKTIRIVKVTEVSNHYE